MAETAKQLEGIVDNLVREIEGRLDDRITTQSRSIFRHDCQR